MNPESLVDIFRATAAKNPSGPAIICADCTLDYAALNLFSDRLAGNLAERGIKKGDRVGLYCPNSDAFVIAYLGIIKSGAAVVPANLLLNPKEIAFIFRDAEISALVYHEVFAASAAIIKPLTPSLKTAIFIGQNKPAPDELSWSEIIAREKKPPEIKINPAEDLVAILYTSGTTGRPKGAMLTHRNITVITNNMNVANILVANPGCEIVVEGGALRRTDPTQTPSGRASLGRLRARALRGASSLRAPRR